MIMKKRFILTIEIDTDVPEAEEWANINDYINNTIDDALGDFRRQNNKNYTRIRPGHAYKVSLRKIKKETIQGKII